MLDKRPNSAGKARNMLLVSDNRAKDVSRPRDAGSVVKLLLSSSSLLRCGSLGCFFVELHPNLEVLAPSKVPRAKFKNKENLPSQPGRPQADWRISMICCGLNLLLWTISPHLVSFSPSCCTHDRTQQLMLHQTSQTRPRLTGLAMSNRSLCRLKAICRTCLDVKIS